MYTEINDDYAFARPYLAPGETILWRGRPEKGHLLSGQDAFMIPFSIFGAASPSSGLSPL